MISICIPTHKTPRKDFFLKRCLDSIHEQTYQDYEIVITQKGKMAENSNYAIKRAKGDLIKILYMDDYLADKGALKRIVEAFKANSEAKWLASGCLHDSNNNSELYNPHYPTYNDEIHTGKNTIGSPSVVTLRKGLNIYFDENMTWLLDCDLYKRLYEKYGEPILLDKMDIVIGIHNEQMTNTMGDEVKIKEHEYMRKKYENN